MIPLTVPLIQNTGIVIMQARNIHQFRSVIYLFIDIENIISSILLVNEYVVVDCTTATRISFIINS